MCLKLSCAESCYSLLSFKLWYIYQVIFSHGCSKMSLRREGIFLLTFYICFYTCITVQKRFYQNYSLKSLLTFALSDSLILFYSCSTPDAEEFIYICYPLLACFLTCGAGTFYESLEYKLTSVVKKKAAYPSSSEIGGWGNEKVIGQ